MQINLKYYTYLSLVIMLFTKLKAQDTTIINAGKIIYERKVNAKAIIDKLYSDGDIWDEAIKTEMSKQKNSFMISSYTYSFNDSTSCFISNDDSNLSESTLEKLYILKNGYNNQYYNNYNSKISKAVKYIGYQGEYILKDSLPKIKWKITNENREIAGYNCRRANAVIYDSIYVVAFFSDRIENTGGPTVFNGLPGLILGVALPFDHISWFATSVEVTPTVVNKYVSSKKKEKELTMPELLKVAQDQGYSTKMKSFYTLMSIL